LIAPAVSVAEAVPVAIMDTVKAPPEPTATLGVKDENAFDPAVWAGEMVPMVVVPLRIAYLTVDGGLPGVAVTTPARLHTKVASATGRYAALALVTTCPEAVATTF